jgi:hypothetical protein
MKVTRVTSQLDLIGMSQSQVFYQTVFRDKHSSAIQILHPTKEIHSQSTQHKRQAMEIILTLIRGLLLLMAPVVSTASSGPVGRCGRWQGWGYVYNNTSGHRYKHQHINYKPLKLIKSHYKAAKRKLSWRHAFLNTVTSYHSDLTARLCDTHMRNKLTNVSHM